MRQKKSQLNSVSLAITGTNQTGKTTYAINFVKEYIRKTGRKVFIINPNGESAWYEHFKMTPYYAGQNMNFEDGKIYITEFKRSLEFFNKKKHEKFNPILEQIYINFEDGLIVFDDAREVVTTKTADNMETILGPSRRQYGVNYICLFHAMDQVPIWLIKYMDYFVYKFTLDEAKLLKRFPPHEIKYQTQINDLIGNGKCNEFSFITLHRRTRKASLYKNPPPNQL